MAPEHRKQRRESPILVHNVTRCVVRGARVGAYPSWRPEGRRSKVAACCVTVTDSFSARCVGHLEINRGRLCHSCVGRLRARHNEGKAWTRSDETKGKLRIDKAGLPWEYGPRTSAIWWMLETSITRASLTRK